MWLTCNCPPIALTWVESRRATLAWRFKTADWGGGGGGDITYTIRSNESAIHTCNKKSKTSCVYYNYDQVTINTAY